MFSTCQKYFRLSVAFGPDPTSVIEYLPDETDSVCSGDVFGDAEQKKDIATENSDVSEDINGRY